MLRPRGNKGELAAVPLSNQPERVTQVLVNQAPMEVECTWMHRGQVIFKFKGVNTISDAQRLAGAEVMIPLEQRPPAPAGEFYQSDLLGCEVFESGRIVGIVSAFEETGGTPLLNIARPNGKELLIPFAKSICTNIDTGKKRIEVHLPEGLEDLN